MFSLRSAGRSRRYIFRYEYYNITAKKSTANFRGFSNFRNTERKKRRVICLTRPFCILIEQGYKSIPVALCTPFSFSASIFGARENGKRQHDRNISRVSAVFFHLFAVFGYPVPVAIDAGERAVFAGGRVFPHCVQTIFTKPFFRIKIPDIRSFKGRKRQTAVLRDGIEPTAVRSRQEFVQFSFA